MKTTSFHIDTPTTSQLCSNAGLVLLASTADRVGVADAVDDQLGDRQKPNLVHTTGHAMTSLALHWRSVVTTCLLYTSPSPRD